MGESGGVILITGASSGLGKVTAIEFLKRNWTVFVAARRVALMADLESLGAHVLQMDVTDDDSVRVGVQTVVDRAGQIDVLFANAGYGSYGTIETVPVDLVTRQFDVNVMGVARTIQAVLPGMRSRRSGRVIITSSIASHISTAGIGYYASTKHAVRAIGTALRQEVSDLGIHVSMIEPGMIRTGFEEVASSALDELNPVDDYVDAHRNIDAYVTRGFQTAPGPERTVEAVLRAASARRPRAIYRTTLHARVFPVADSLIGRRLADLVSLTFLRRASRKIRAGR